ncbi:S-adenosyl-L-methionine-dependent methyltransferase [Geopyxis carbonaria]|nr:S-adenosyl-L-methionine-dependent methyltransferase [Geopyxis carbonaria]
MASSSAPIEADLDAGTSSDYGSSLASETASLSSSIVDYVYENGRRYHRLSEGKYTLPNDETEQDRLDLYHHQNLLMLGGRLHVAPLKPENLARVLDCGTGTGIWALDMGEAHPEAHIIGADLSAIQPSWVFPNVEFQVDDLEQEWTWPDNHFSFIHSRTIGNSIRDWPAYVGRMYDHTAPGGWVELAELEMKLYCDDNTLKGTILDDYFQLFMSSAGKAGLHFPDAAEYIKMLTDAGFVDVRIEKFVHPWGAWPKDKALKQVGLCLEISVVNNMALEAYALALFTRFGGLTQQEATKMCKDVAKVVLSRKVHAYNHLWHVIGRKPEKK